MARVRGPRPVRIGPHRSPRCDARRYRLKPGAPNRIAVRSRAPIHIAILSTPEFDATTVDPARTCFGDAELPAERACSQTGSSPPIRDVDRDGDSGLVLAYATDKTGIGPGDTRACLVGYTFADVPVADCEAVAAN